MTVASALTALSQDITAARTAITAKGGTVTANGGSSQLATDISTIPSGGGEYPLTRVVDDNNNEIGTAFMEFTDAIGSVYKVIILDAQYRSTSKNWCSDRNTVTNMPLYNSNYDLWWYDNAQETATQNTQLILDYCTANGYTSSSCSHCRSLSFTIDGTTYYGQLPNTREVFDMWRQRVQIEQMDTSASSKPYTNFSSTRAIWSSTQSASTAGFLLNTGGVVNSINKTSVYIACPVLEIPLS